MEQFFPRADQWVFDYMMYKYVANYSDTEPDLSMSRTQQKFGLGRQSSVIKDLIHEGLDRMPPNRRKVHLLLLVFIMQEIEEISCGCKIADSDDDENDAEVESRSDLSVKDCDTILIHLRDLQKSLSVFLNEREKESVRDLARKCLVDSIVMMFQYSLKVGSGEKEALDTLERLVVENGSVEVEESYNFCRNLKPISGKFRPVSDFISTVKELIGVINSCFEIPDLIQFAINSLEDSTVAIEHLLQDQRPSRKADVWELSLGLTDVRKQELDQLIARTEVDSFPAMAEVEQGTQPAHQPKSPRIRHWWQMRPSTRPDNSVKVVEQRAQLSTVPSISRIQEKERVPSSTVSSTPRLQEKQKTPPPPSTVPSTSGIQEKQKTSPPPSTVASTSRIQEKQKTPPSTVPSTSSIQGPTEPPSTRSRTSNPEGTNGSPKGDRPGSSYIAALGKRMKEFNAEVHMVKLRKMDERMNRIKKYIGPPSHQIARLGPWLPEEETKFIEETLRIGIGNWVAIKQSLGTARSSQQLKDKWRNLHKSHIKEAAKRLDIAYP